MRIEVNTHTCIGSGVCVLIAPSVFDQSEDTGFAELLTDRPPAGQRGNVTQAAMRCPSGAISLDDS
ncbi:ferredoxin [Spongiactinospora sp. 9N601]|uniref:ferredoxin n=1 Tax=Spongiactinospora sp. 9N601 TaxID=3375149 RepID=UPI00379015E0